MVWSVEKLEAAMLADASVAHGWRLIERFATLNRESGSADEHAAADYIAEQLRQFGVPYEMHEPELYLSLPRAASVTLGTSGAVLQGKPPAFAATSPASGITAPAVHVPSAKMKDVTDIFDDRRGAADVRGKIVVSEGYAMPAAVQRFERAGALAQVYINPGKRVHWGICTPIWGTPTDRDLDRKPKTPVAAISRPDGDRLLEHVRNGGAVTVRTVLEEGWYRCKLPVATIAGKSDDFLLVHGHYDSWDVGIGDNAVGDATLLEIARILHTHRAKLRRSARVAWWPGHSMGRYAGSTWYADQFALELRQHCVAAVNIDSPGCWRATAYEEVMWMAEADALCRGSIRDATGVEPHRLRPIRAGDYSFNQIGLTSFFMLLSNIPKAERDELGFYPVGGCGGNIAWHTEDDLLPVADRDHLLRDLTVYLTAVARVLNAEVLPFDHRAAVRELAEAVEKYKKEAGNAVDLSPVENELRALADGLERFYRKAKRGAAPSRLARINDTVKELSRLLVPLNYAAGERFAHDPALPLGVIPRLADIGRLRECPADLRRFLVAGITREINLVANTLHEAVRLVSARV
ncbi:MAG TPA: M28 family peptidase [Gemmatimonadales bacterium]|nr:M28 family peptidase [Gemmatimonadales bacterium]